MSNDFFSSYENEVSTEDLYIKTNYLPFDLVTGGKGLPLGGFTHLYGGNGLGKTTLLYTVVKNLVIRGEGVLWVGAENTKELANSMGLYGEESFLKKPEYSHLKDKFRYLDAGFYTELEEISREFIKSPYRVMVIDSMTAFCASPETIKEKGIEDVLVGLDARIQTQYFKLYANLLKSTKKSIIFVTQSRADIGGRSFGFTAPQDKPATGNAGLFYSILRVLLQGDATLKASDMGQQGDHQVGKTGWLKAEKNRMALPFVRLPVFILFGKGASNIQALRSYMEAMSYFKSAGSRFQISFKGTEVSVAGRKGLLDWISNNMDALMEDVYENISAYYNILSLGAFKNIKGQAPMVATSEVQIEVPSSSILEDKKEA